MKDKPAVERILTLLDELYPWQGRCFLDYEQPWQLLFATILSAQCTDDRVNQVTEVLFKKYTSLDDFADADLNELEADVRATGFFHMKALHIRQSAELLRSRHNGVLPGDIGSLTALPGVGRKTANVILGHIFDIPSIVVDTHVKRVSFKLGLTRHTDPEKIEYELMKTLPKDHWIRYNQQVVTHGRRICAARSPKCGVCGLAEECDSANMK